MLNTALVKPNVTAAKKSNEKLPSAKPRASRKTGKNAVKEYNMNFNKAEFYTSYGLFSQIPKSEKRDCLFGQEQRRKILPDKQDTEQKVACPCKLNAGQDGDYQLLFG